MFSIYTFIMRCYHNGRRLVLLQGDCDPLLLIEIHGIYALEICTKEG